MKVGVYFFALLVSLILATDRKAHGAWADERVAGPFICRADHSLAGYAPLIQDLGQLQGDLARMLDIAAPREHVELIFFHDERTYAAYMRTYFPNVPYRRALFIKGAGAGRVYVYQSPELPVDVRHESTHALLHAVLPMVPLWLDEGLAEYFEVPAQERAFGNPYLKKLKFRSTLGMAPKLVHLEAKRDLEEMSAADYQAAWAWVHFMLHGPVEARQELLAFLGDIRASTPPGTLSQRLERRLPNVERRLAQHFKSWKR